MATHCGGASADTFDLAALRRALGVRFDDGSGRNTKRRRGQPDAYPCAFCGKACPNPARLVRCSDGTIDVVATDEYADRPENRSGDMGGYPIGLGCLRKIKRALDPDTFARFFKGFTPVARMLAGAPGSI